MYKRTRWGFCLVALILAGAIYSIYELDFEFGIDLQGGTELTYELDLSNVDYDVASANIAATVKDMIAARLNTYGLRDISVSTQGSDRLVVQIPGTVGSQTVDQLRTQIEEAGNLEFMLVAESGSTDRELTDLQKAVTDYNSALVSYAQAKSQQQDVKPPALPAKLAELDAAHKQYRREMGAFERVSEAEQATLTMPSRPAYRVLPRAISQRQTSGASRLVDQLGSFTVLRSSDDFTVSGRYLDSSKINITRDEKGGPAIAFGFDPIGATYFAKLTGDNTGKALAIVLDGRVLQSPNIQDRIGASGIISGQFSYDEVQGVVNILRGGSLPTKPNLISESTIGPALGRASVQNGIVAVMSGLVVVLVFMLIYYVVGGFVANIALTINLVLILSYVLVFRQTLTFPGIAGIILTIGMAVDANILIFERVREELRKGKSLLVGLGSGYQRAFWVIFDSNLTTLITGMVLFRFGTGPVRGFAVTLIAGIIASFFTSVFVTRIILSFMANKGIIKKFPMMRLIGVPRVDFQRHKKLFVTGSVVVILASWIGFVVPRGESNYGVDFRGGSRITMRLKHDVSRAQLEGWIGELPETDRELFSDFSIQSIDASDEGTARSFTLIVSQPKSDDADAAQQPADKVRVIVERMLREQDLLLPEPYPTTDLDGKPISNPNWVPAVPVGGNELIADGGLELEINTLYVDPSLNEARLKDLLNQHLASTFAEAIRTASEEGFTGIEVTDLDVRGETDLGAGSGDKLTRFFVKTTGYQEAASVIQGISAVPSHPQVVDAVTDFFKGNSPVLQDALNVARTIELSEPFPEVVGIGPRVASNLQRQALVAVFIAIVAIIFYLSLRFEFTFGLAAIIALIHDVAVTIGVMAVADMLFGDVFSLKINLPEVAALLTIIGYSVNDSIVVFDRIRENLQAGKRRIEFEDLVNASINQTLARTIWTSSTTLVMVSALLIFGGEPIKGFAFAFAIGLISGTYSSVFVASPALIFLRSRFLARQERIKAQAQVA